MTPPGAETVFREDVPIPAGVVRYNKLDSGTKAVNFAEVRESEEWDRFDRKISGLFFGEYTFDYTVTFFVDESGNVYDAQVTKANSQFGIDELEAACKLVRFTPGSYQGYPTKYYFVRDFSFGTSFHPNYQPPVPTID